jgi:hypothetical protein
MVLFNIAIQGPGHQAIVSHEALVCTLGSAAVETAVDSTSRLDSSTVLGIPTSWKIENPFLNLKV